MTFSTYNFPESPKILEEKIKGIVIDDEVKEVYSKLLITSFYKGLIINDHLRNSNNNLVRKYTIKYENQVKRSFEHLDVEYDFVKLGFELALYSFKKGTNVIRYLREDNSLDKSVENLLNLLNN
ncbi:hypothetical protein KY334_01295 [Candidatus Woesearchaeota archaeon]|nr:hypothetical protein [Candidatus Woesearchaeota archaeon]